MTTLTSVKYEFRCSTCYQLQYAPVDEAGSEFECRCCQHQMLAPDATPERIARAADAIISDDSPAGMFAPETPLSVDELEELVRQQTKKRKVRGSNEQCRNPSRSSAARISRLFAQIVDGIASLLAGALGVFTVPVACFLGVLDRAALTATTLFLEQLGRASATGQWSALEVPPLAWPVIVTAALPAMLLTVLQLRWLSTRGQTVGKRLIGIRIVNGEGYAPGFIRGVVLRNWVPVAVCLYPVSLAGDAFFVSDMTRFGIQFLSWANIAAIVMEPPRCLHDHLAGTYVVDA